MKKIIALTALIAAISAHAQQDPQYNLYQFNQLLINPAYAGARDGLTIAGSRREQWRDFPGAPKTTALSVHGPVLKKNIGLGLTILKDEIGPRDVLAAYGNFAYILRLNPKWKLSFGINGGYNRFQFRFDKIDLETQETPAELANLNNINRGALDINSGLFLRSNDFFAGLSATHLNSPKVLSLDDAGNGKLNYRLNTHLFFTVGKSFELSENVLFSPSILVKNIKSQTHADLNVNFFLYKKLWLGAFFRTNYGPGGLLQYYVTNRFRVAYSYDSGVVSDSRLGGSHEIMIGYDFAGSKSNKMINPRFL